MKSIEFWHIILLIYEWNVISISAGESGSADTVRDPRGFAVKFYSEEGNWDLTGNNTPIFFIRDALLVSGCTIGAIWARIGIVLSW